MVGSPNRRTERTSGAQSREKRWQQPDNQGPGGKKKQTTFAQRSGGIGVDGAHEFEKDRDLGFKGCQVAWVRKAEVDDDARHSCTPSTYS